MFSYAQIVDGWIACGLTFAAIMGLLCFVGYLALKGTKL